MAKPAPKPRKKGSFLTIASFAFVFLIMFDSNLRDSTGRIVGYVFNPLVGFNDKFPVLTIMLAGTLMVLLTTVIRHFTTDWLEMARSQAIMRQFQKEMGAARKENNTYKLKKLQEMQPEIMQMQSQMSTKQLKNMPMTMIIVIPIFAWLFTFVTRLDHAAYATPWNQAVDMFATNGFLFGSSVFPHWILLYMVLSIPLGALAGKAMKFLSWKERWQDRHPDVHE